MRAIADAGRSLALDSGKAALRVGQEATMQHTIYTRDKLTLEAHLEDDPYILLRREGQSGSVPVYPNEVRYPADATCSMAAQIAGIVVGDDESGDDEGLSADASALALSQPSSVFTNPP